jgi:hypothetical protein
MNGRWLAGFVLPMLLASLPASNNFQLNSYGFGTGGTANSSSSNYRINGIAGEAAGNSSSSNYNLGAGETYVKQAHVPTIALANNARWYNKLLVTIGTENNPSDTLYAIAISSDNFATTQYVKSDLTVGSALVLSDYHTYAALGSGSGAYIRGLTPGTVYTVKAKAIHGSFTETGWGPTASAATQYPQLTFDIDIAPTDTSTSPPYQVNMGDLLAGTVVSATDKIWVSFDTNAESGGTVYASGQYSGLHSAATTYTISTLTGDISAQPEGFGVQGSSATQSSGGPFALLSPYDGSGQNVGSVTSSLAEVFRATAPVISARGSVVLKAKSQANTASASDYTEILTLLAAGHY